MWANVCRCASALFAIEHYSFHCVCDYTMIADITPFLPPISPTYVQANGERRTLAVSGLLTNSVSITTTTTATSLLATTKD